MLRFCWMRLTNVTAFIDSARKADAMEKSHHAVQCYPQSLAGSLCECGRGCNRGIRQSLWKIRHWYIGTRINHRRKLSSTFILHISDLSQSLWDFLIRLYASLGWSNIAKEKWCHPAPFEVKTSSCAFNHIPSH